MPDLWKLMGWLPDALEELKPVGAPEDSATTHEGNGGNGAEAASGVVSSQPRSEPDD
jgi:hypothetical protein